MDVPVPNHWLIASDISEALALSLSRARRRSFKTYFTPMPYKALPLRNNSCLPRPAPVCSTTPGWLWRAGLHVRFACPAPPSCRVPPWRSRSPYCRYAQYRQEYPAENGKDYPVLDAGGKGCYVGRVYALRTRSPAWFGEGDEKTHIDGEAKPSIRGTGTEDYFLSASPRPGD